MKISGITARYIWTFHFVEMHANRNKREYRRVCQIYKNGVDRTTPVVSRGVCAARPTSSALPTSRATRTAAQTSSGSAAAPLPSAASAAAIGDANTWSVRAVVAARRQAGS